MTDKLERSRLTIRIQPGAMKREIVGLKDGVWRLRIDAPPVEGKANKRIIEFLSETLAMPKSSINIERGLTSRNKIVSINGLSSLEADSRLRRAVQK